LRDSGTTRGANASAASPIGTLIRKTLRQPSPAMSACTSRPPISWPPTAASPIARLYAVSARVRSAPAEVSRA
jgi:hypothetical protein